MATVLPVPPSGVVQPEKELPSSETGALPLLQTAPPEYELEVFSK
jgi:hypothetical protein